MHPDAAGQRTPMRLQQRSQMIIGVGLALAFIVVFPATFGSWFGIPGPLWLIAYAIGMNVAAHRLLRCPHCHKSVMKQASGRHTLFFGTRCPHCGEQV